MHRFVARYRLDEYEEFVTDTIEVDYETYDLQEALKRITGALGSKVTVLSIERLL